MNDLHIRLRLLKQQSQFVPMCRPNERFDMHRMAASGGVPIDEACADCVKVARNLDYWICSNKHIVESEHSVCSACMLPLDEKHRLANNAMADENMSCIVCKGTLSHGQHSMFDYWYTCQNCARLAKSVFVACFDVDTTIADNLDVALADIVEMRNKNAAARTASLSGAK